MGSQIKCRAFPLLIELLITTSTLLVLNFLLAVLS